MGASRIVLPDRLHLVGLAVLERDLELAVDGGVDLGVERALLGDAARDRTLGEVGLGVVVELVPHDVGLVLPQARLGIEVGEVAGRVVLMQRVVGVGAGEFIPYHEALRAAALLEVALLEQACSHGLSARPLNLMVNRNAAGRLHAVDHEEGGVSPALHIQVVVQLILDDDIGPSKSQCAVGAGLEVHVDVGLVAQVGHARVDGNVGVGRLGEVNRGTAALVVVGDLGGAAPRNVNAGTVGGGHPGVGVLRDHHRCHVARALADLPGGHGVGRTDHLQPRSIGMLGPDARGAAHEKHGLAAVLVHELMELLGDGAVRLIPGDAHPARVGGTLGIRALHGVVDAVGVVGGLDGRLALGAAVAHRVERRLGIALDLDRAAVLHGDDDAALVLAAGAAAGADELHAIALVTHLCLDKISLVEWNLGQRAQRRACEGRCRAGDCCHFGERAARHAFLHVHVPPLCFLYVFVHPKSCLAAAQRNH